MWIEIGPVLVNANVIQFMAVEFDKVVIAGPADGSLKIPFDKPDQAQTEFERIKGLLMEGHDAAHASN